MFKKREPNMHTNPVNATRPAALVLSMAAGLFRLLPSWLRPYNLAPVGAIGIFGGARLCRWQAFLLPLAIMVGSDFLLGVLRGHEYGLWHYSRIFVYSSVLVYVLIGRLLTRTEAVWWIAGASLLGSLQFFVITNFGDWLYSPLNYPKDLTGLVECYVAALPFFHPTVISDLGFTAILFGTHAVLSRTVAPAEKVRVQTAS
jgi:hypothetical protein